MVRTFCVVVSSLSALSPSISARTVSSIALFRDDISSSIYNTFCAIDCFVAVISCHIVLCHIDCRHGVLGHIVNVGHISRFDLSRQTYRPLCRHDVLYHDVLCHNHFCHDVPCHVSELTAKSCPVHQVSGHRLQK